MFSCIFDSSCNVQSWWTSHKDSFIFYHVICHMKCFFIFDLVGFVNHSSIKVICRTIKPYSLNYSIERIFKSISFFLLIGVKNTIFNFVKKSTSLRIRKDNINFRIFLFQILGHSCYWSTCTSSTNESIKQAIGLFINLRTCLFIMNMMIIKVLKLIHEKSWSFRRIRIGQIIIMIRIYNWDRRNFLYVCTQNL